MSSEQIPVATWVCGECGRAVERYRGQGDVTCECGAEYNAFGQRLRDDWRANPSTWDDEVDDLEGFEVSQVAADARLGEF